LPGAGSFCPCLSGVATSAIIPAASLAIVVAHFLELRVDDVVTLGFLGRALLLRTRAGARREEARRALASAGSAVALAEAAESSACKALERHRRLAGRR
jgi:hypothetical protein